MLQNTISSPPFCKSAAYQNVLTNCRLIMWSIPLPVLDFLAGGGFKSSLFVSFSHCSMFLPLFSVNWFYDSMVVFAKDAPSTCLKNWRFSSTCWQRSHQRSNPNLNMHNAYQSLWPLFSYGSILRLMEISRQSLAGVLYSCLTRFRFPAKGFHYSNKMGQGNTPIQIKTSLAYF